MDYTFNSHIGFGVDNSLPSLLDKESFFMFYEYFVEICYRRDTYVVCRNHFVSEYKY